MAVQTAPALRHAVVGVFDSSSQAHSAVEDLRNAGFMTSEIGVAARNLRGEWDEYVSLPTEDDDGERIAQGAAAGVATGAGIGGLWALGITAGLLPAIGPVIAGGLLASILASAAAGAAVGGLVGGLIALGIPEEEARTYEEEFTSGRVLVTVRTDDRYDEAAQILRTHGARHVRDQY